MSDLAIPELNLTTATLEELAAAAHLELNASRQHLVGALGRQIRLGEILLEVQERLGSVQNFRDWREQNFGTRHFGQRAMRLATHRSHLPEEAFDIWTDANSTEHLPTTSRALAYLRGLPDVNQRGGRGRHYQEDRKVEAVRLHAEGLGYDEIAELLGASRPSVYYWCNPDKYRAQQKRNLARSNANKRQREAEARALKKQQERDERDRLAKATGGELAEAYSLIRRALAALDKAGETEAMRHAHKCEDAIVAALRAERTAS